MIRRIGINYDLELLWGLLIPVGLNSDISRFLRSNEIVVALAMRPLDHVARPLRAYSFHRVQFGPHLGFLSMVVHTNCLKSGIALR